jgi:hypothetical protein
LWCCCKQSAHHNSALCFWFHNLVTFVLVASSSTFFQWFGSSTTISSDRENHHGDDDFASFCFGAKCAKFLEHSRVWSSSDSQTYLGGNSCKIAGQVVFPSLHEQPGVTSHTTLTLKFATAAAFRLPGHELTVDDVGDIWIRVIVAHPRTECIHGLLPCIPSSLGAPHRKHWDEALLFQRFTIDTCAETMSNVFSDLSNPIETS